MIAVQNGAVELIGHGKEREVNGINAGMKRLTERPFCPQCYLFLDEHDDNACNLRWIEEEQEEQEKLEQRMCMECVEAGAAAVTILASWRLWLHRVLAFLGRFV